MKNKRSPLNPAWLLSAAELTEWALLKDANLPTLPGSPKWYNYVGFLEEKLLEYGVVDVTKNRLPFERWFTSDTASNWSLVSDGEPVKVAFYGANSGSTGAEGVSAELVYYDHKHPPVSIKDKIVVIPTRPHPQPPYDDHYLRHFSFNDYEYQSEDPFPPLYQFVDPAETFTFDIWWQLCQRLHEIAIAGGAAGLLIVYDMAFERTVGLYSFPTPALYDVPTLILDREAGAKVIVDAKAGKSGTLRLEATVEAAEAYQLIAYLPGKAYGTPADEQILLVNHTDGPSITQDNGALGLLAIVNYYSHIPQSQRERTLTLFLDCRHYMPGMEQANRDGDWLTRHPEAKEPIVGLIQIEHLGEMDYREVDGRVEAVGLPEQSYLWARNNQPLIDAAIATVKEHGLSRVHVVAPERAGIHGGVQHPWWGVGVMGQRKQRCDVWHCLDVPSYGFGSFLGYYWTTESGIERWNCELSLAQIKTMTELTGVLMTADLEEIEPK